MHGNDYRGADYTSQTDTDFDWYNPHLNEGTTANTKVVLIIVFEASEVFIVLLVKFNYPLHEKKYLTDMFFLLHSMKNFFYKFFRLCGSNAKMNLHVHFYVYAGLKYHHFHIPMMYIHYCFLPLFCLPLVEWYMNDIDKSLGLPMCLGFTS